MAVDYSYFRSSTTFMTDARRIAPRMVVDCSYLRLSTAFTTVRTPYCSADVSALLIPPLVNGISNGSRAILLREWQRVAHTYTRQPLSRQIVRRIVPRMAVDCSYLCSSTAFLTVCARYGSVDGSALLIPLLVNGFPDGLRAVWLS